MSGQSLAASHTTVELEQVAAQWVPVKVAQHCVPAGQSFGLSQRTDTKLSSPQFAAHAGLAGALLELDLGTQQCGVSPLQVSSPQRVVAAFTRQIPS